MKKLLLFLVLLAATCGMIAAEKKPVDVLLLGYYIWMPKNYRAELKKQGIHVFVHPNDRLSGDTKLYPLEFLKKFNVVVASGPIGRRWSPRFLNTLPQGMVDRLMEYQKAGGAVVWIPLGVDKAIPEWNDAIGKRIGVEAVDAHVSDPANTEVIFRPGGRTVENMAHYFRTSAIAKHPVTEGVRNLFINTRGEWSSPGAIPGRFGKEWTVLVRAEKGSSVKADKAGSEPNSGKNIAKTIDYPEPALIGVREGTDGGGRMALFPLYTAGTWGNFNHIALYDVFLRYGNGRVKSDGEKLLVNLFRWLAAPEKGFGGYHLNPQIEKKKAKPLDLSVMKYRKTLPPNASLGKSWRGLIGARSKNGGGSGTVREWADAAKNAGLDYLVFIDDVTKYNPKTYAAFVKECHEASSKDFLVYPGFGGMDASGVFRYYTGAKKFPAAESGFLNAKGEIALPHKLVGLNGWGTVGGVAYISRMPYDPWYLWITSTGAVLVYENGKVIDNGIQRWIDSNELNNSNLGPVALVRMNSPSEVTEMAEKAHSTVVFGATPLLALERAMKNGCGEQLNIYISSGPRIQYWGASGTWLNPWRPNSDRAQFGLSVTSDAGLKTIEVVEGYSKQTIRRIELHGEKKFHDFLFNLNASRQVVLTLKVTDVNGNTAIAPYYNWFPTSRLWLMGDRLMGMHHFSDLTGENTVFSGGGPVSIPYNKTFTFAAGMAKSPVEPGVLKIRGFDGGNVYLPSMHLTARINRKGGKAEELVGRYYHRFATYDAFIWDQQTEFKRKPGEKFNFNGVVPGMVPPEVAEIRIRNYGTRQLHNADFFILDYDFEIRFKQDTVVNSIWLTSGTANGGKDEFDRWYLRPSGNAEKAETEILPLEQNYYKKNKLGPGGYVYLAPFLGGSPALIARDIPDELTVNTTSHWNPKKKVAWRGNSIQFDFKGGRLFKKGDVYKFSMLMATRKFGPGQESNAWLEKAVKDFGIHQKPGYAYTLEQGKVRSINYFFDAETENGGVILSIPKYKIEQRIPVRIHGIRKNTVAGEYNRKTGRVRVLPLFENAVMISTVNPNICGQSFYFGEFLEWNNSALTVTLVPDEAIFRLEIHNPTDKAQSYSVRGIRGFAPFAKFTANGTLPPYKTKTLDLVPEPGTVRMAIHR